MFVVEASCPMDRAFLAACVGQAVRQLYWHLNILW